MANVTTSVTIDTFMQAASQISARTALGLGSLATQSGTFSGTSSGTNTGDQTFITGNAGSATVLETGREINGVTFNGSQDITIAAAAGTLTGATLAGGVVNSSLTSVGTLTGLTVTGTISGSITGNAGTATALQNARTINGTSFNGTANITVAAAAGTLTGTSLPATVTGSSLTSVGTLAALTVTGTITGSVTGNAGTATVLQTARTINGTSFNGSANITVAAAAGTLTGSALASGVTSSSLTSVGTLTGLAVTGTISGSISGNAATATALQAPRAINGTNFDGTTDITIAAQAGTLTGATLAPGVTNSSLTQVGTIAVGTWNASTIPLNRGGTGATTAAGVRAVLGLPEPSTNIVDASSTRTLALADSNQLIQLTNGTGTTLTIPDNSTVNWSGSTPVPQIFIQRGASAGPITISGSGITINNNVASELPQGDYGSLRWKSSNVWDWISGTGVSWSDIDTKPTTLAGFGITDGITSTAVATGYQPLDSDLTAIAALSTTSFGRSLLALADAAALRTAIVLPVEIGIACSDETTALTTGTAKATFRAPFAFTLTSVKASLTTAPTGSTMLIDINEAGTTVLSTKLMINASSKTSVGAATPYVISDSAIAADAEITIDIDQIGSSVAGAGLKVWLIGTR